MIRMQQEDRSHPHPKAPRPPQRAGQAGTTRALSLSCNTLGRPGAAAEATAGGNDPNAGGRNDPDAAGGDAPTGGGDADAADGDSEAKRGTRKGVGNAETDGKAAARAATARNAETDGKAAAR